MAIRPNVVFIFADEWRARATGYAGNRDVETPVLDALAAGSVNATHAVSGCPVCCPYRASLMTGQYPLTHGVFINDVELDPDCDSIARVFGRGGYDTAYIGKWHLHGSPDGHGGRRKERVPRSHQLGFDTWMGYECCHDYWNSPYYLNDDPTEHRWAGYDAFAQSQAAADYIRAHAHARTSARDAGPEAGQGEAEGAERDGEGNRDRPYLLMLSWGPPHFPLHTAPEPYRMCYADRDLSIPPNVPEAHRDAALAELRGYYAHIAALDDALQVVLHAVDETDPDNTLVVVTSDHGDMAWSQGLPHKLYPFDESIRVPFLLRWPAGLDPVGGASGTTSIPIDAPDILPTLAGLCGLSGAVPEAVEGRDWSPILRGEAQATGDEAALLGVAAATTWMRAYDLPPYRGLRTARHTYAAARTARGVEPWLLFDNHVDPEQMHNLVYRPEAAGLQAELHARLLARLEALGDRFEPGATYLERAGRSHYAEANWPIRTPWSYPWAESPS